MSATEDLKATFILEEKLTVFAKFITKAQGSQSRAQGVDAGVYVDLTIIV